MSDIPATKIGDNISFRIYRSVQVFKVLKSHPLAIKLQGCSLFFPKIYIPVTYIEYSGIWGTIII